MRFRTTLVLLVVVVGLGLFILLYERKTPGSGSGYDKLIFPELKEEQARKKIDRVEIDRVEIDRVEIDRVKDEKRGKIVIEKKDEGHWEITEPIKYRADKYKASGVVSDLGYAEKREVKKGVRAIRPEEGEELKLEDYGLGEKSAAFIRVYSQGELVHELKVGDKGPGGENCYVQAMPDESVVYVSETSLYTGATDDLSSYRDKNVVLVKPKDVEKLVVARPEETLEFVKKEGAWEMVSPVKDRTKSDDVQSLVSTCTSLRADEFVKDGAGQDDLKGYGLDAPEYRVVLTAKEKGEPTERQILFGKVQEGKAKDRYRYCMRGGDSTVFTVNFDNISRDMLKEVGEYRDKKLIKVDPDDANALAIEQEAGKLRFAKVKYDWKIEEPQDQAGDADYDAVKKVLEELRDAEIKGYLPPGTELSGGIQVTVGFKSKKNPEESFTVLKSGNKALAGRKGSKNVFAVDPALVDRLSESALHFMSKKIFHVPSSDVVWLRIEKEDGAETAENAAGEWKLVETPGDMDVDRVKNDIVWGISDLYAQRLFGDVEDQELERYGLSKPWAKVTFRYREKVKADEGQKEEIKEAMVLFGSETEDGRRHAKLADTKMVFEARASLVEGVEKGICKETNGGEEGGEDKGQEEDKKE